MINIRPLIQDHLKTIPDFKEVAGASDLASLLAGRLSDQGCYVFQERDIPSENQSIVDVVQNNAEHYCCVITVRNVRDMRGADAADVSFNLKSKVMDKLLGWVAHADVEQLAFAGGGLVSFANGLHIYKISFKTSQFIQSQ